jgi:hypothetical protein
MSRDGHLYQVNHGSRQRTVIALRRAGQNGQFDRGGSYQLRGVDVRRMLKTGNLGWRYANL